MTGVTDCASNMTATTGSTTSRKYDLTEKWMGCIAHQLNRCMRHAIDKPYIDHHVVLNDINSVKAGVRILKQTGDCNKLPVRKKLIQAVETIFATYFDVAERFINVSSDVESILNEQTRTSGQEPFQKLSRYINDTDGSTNFPALEAIVTCLKPIRKMQ